MKPFAKKYPLYSAALLALLCSTFVQAAAFDCGKAQANVEKHICANAQLSKLDNAFNDVFYQTAEIAENRPLLERAQYQWLRDVRDKCRDDTCLENVYRQRLAIVKSTKRRTWAAYSNKKLGVSFLYPTNYLVKVGPRDTSNQVTIQARGSSQDFDILASLEVLKGNFADNLEEQGFSFENGGWVTQAGLLTVPAVEVARNGWKGLKANMQCGWNDEETGYHAGGLCVVELLSNGHMTVSIQSEGAEPQDEALELMDSLRLLR